MKSIKLTLDQEYEIHELTCGQLEDIQELVGAFGTTSGQVASISKETSRAIIAVALSVDHPEVTQEALRKMRLGTVKALNNTVRQVLRFGGFVEEDPKPGEAVAGVA